MNEEREIVITLRFSKFRIYEVDGASVPTVESKPEPLSIEGVVALAGWFKKSVPESVSVANIIGDTPDKKIGGAHYQNPRLKRGHFAVMSEWAVSVDQVDVR